MFDAFMTADIVAADLISSTTSSRSPLPIEVLAGSKRVVKWSDWERIDTEERRRGVELGKKREKMTNLDSLLKFLN